MCRLDRTRAHVDGRTPHFVRVEQLKAQTNSHDIGYRVYRTDLMKMNAFQGDLVNASFHVTELLKDRRGQVANGLR